jgi:hypothetical protein
MGLDVEQPDPPDLTNRPLPTAVDPETVADDDLRREELEAMLRDGAWSEAFNEWAEYTDLTEAEYRTLEAAGLFAALSVYWDPVAEDLRFELPAIGDAVATDDDLTDRAVTELDDLGRTVVAMLEDGYLDWGEDAAVEDVWREWESEESSFDDL